jgi:rubredoxin
VIGFIKMMINKLFSLFSNKEGERIMAEPYLCPSCKTNRSRFNIIDQNPQYVKKDPQTGDIINTFSHDELDPFHLPYRGSEKRIQCGACGLIEDERSFVAMAKYNPRQEG